MPRILVIEDDPEIREMLATWFRQEGFAVTTAPTGEAGLDAAFAAPHDIILLDLALPGKDGYDVCRRLRLSGKTKNTPVIAATALKARENIVEAKQVGFDDYVVKPFSLSALIEKVRRHVGLGAALEERATAKPEPRQRALLKIARYDDAAVIVLDGGYLESLYRLEQAVNLVVGQGYRLIHIDLRRLRRFTPKLAAGIADVSRRQQRQGVAIKVIVIDNTVLSMLYNSDVARYAEIVAKSDCTD